MTFTLTREQLYDLVWSEAMQSLSKKIGVSDVAIAKQCRLADVPVPRRGYWNKKQAGHRVVKSPLPKRDLATPWYIQMKGRLTYDLKSQIVGEPGDVIEPESIDVLTDRFRKRLGSVKVPVRFST